MNVAYPIIDADGHVRRKIESCTIISAGRLTREPRFETYPTFLLYDGGTAVPACRERS